MPKKIVFGLPLIIAIAGLIWYIKVARPTAPKEGSVQLSYNLCLDAGLEAQPFTLDTTAFLSYRTQHWLDSSRQYFGKALTLTKKDTLVVSVINGLDFKSSSELLLQSSGRVMGKKREQEGPVEIFWIWCQSPDDTWWVRYMVVDKQMGSSVLIDQPAADSTGAEQSFLSSPLPKMIKRCI
jgi:hypothetical protein